MEMNNKINFKTEHDEFQIFGSQSSIRDQKTQDLCLL